MTNTLNPETVEALRRMIRDAQEHDNKVKRACVDQMNRASPPNEFKALLDDILSGGCQPWHAFLDAYEEEASKLTAVCRANLHKAVWEELR